MSDEPEPVTWYPCTSCGAAHNVPFCPFPEVQETIMATLLVDSLRQQVATLTRMLDEGAIDIATAKYYGHTLMPNQSFKLLKDRAEAAERQVAALTQERDELLIARGNDKELLLDEIRAKLSVEATVATLQQLARDARALADGLTATGRQALSHGQLDRRLTKLAERLEQIAARGET